MIERLALKNVISWTPVIKISPVNSVTFQLEVESLGSGLDLRARLFPEFGEAFAGTSGFSYTNGVYSATLNLDYPALNGNIQLWVNEGPDSSPYTNPRRETIVAYRIGGNPGFSRGGGGFSRGGGWFFLEGVVVFLGVVAVSHGVVGQI